MAEDGLSEKLRAAVEALIGSVREMLDASRLLRNRIEQNDDIMTVIEEGQRGLADRIDTLERRLSQAERKLNNIGDYPSSIP